MLSVKQNISILCMNIRKVLVNAVKVLEVKVENALSKALVLTAYHTTIIHLLFPRLDSPTDQTIVSEELLTDFCVSAQSLLEPFSVVDAEHHTDYLITRIRSSTFADVFVLGLDVCSRAIEYFLTRLHCGSASEVENINRTIATLMSIASDMHAISKSETLLTAKNLRLVKKKLKTVKLQLHSLDPSHGSGSSCSVEEQPSGSLTPLDALISGMPSFEPNTPLQDLWPNAAPMEVGSMPYDVFSADGVHSLNQAGLMEDLVMYDFDNGDPRTRLSRPKRSTELPSHHHPASARQGHDDPAMVLDQHFPSEHLPGLEMWG
ncbi:MAG: hypothetical protein Q9221_007385 [Calogaya cf. arnoldii]